MAIYTFVKNHITLKPIILSKHVHLITKRQLIHTKHARLYLHTQRPRHMQTFHFRFKLLLRKHKNPCYAFFVNQTLPAHTFATFPRALIEPVFRYYRRLSVAKLCRHRHTARLRLLLWSE